MIEKRMRAVELLWLEHPAAVRIKVEDVVGDLFAVEVEDSSGYIEQFFWKLPVERAWYGITV